MSPSAVHSSPHAQCHMHTMETVFPLYSCHTTFTKHLPFLFWPECTTNTHRQHKSPHGCTDVDSHTHFHTQLEPAWCALRTELVGIKLSIFFAAHRRRRAGKVSPNALKIGLPQHVSWGLKYKSAFPPLSWSWPFSQGPARMAVCGIEKK